MAQAPAITVALDADDTLWESEVHFHGVEERFRSLIHRYVGDTIDGAETDSRLNAVERANLALFGFGVKAFTLSMIETAIQLTDGAISTDDIAAIIGWGKEMMAHPVDLLDGVVDTIEALAPRYRLALITKGDLLHQEGKIASSGLADHFEIIEIVSEKDSPTYQRILDRHGLDPSAFVMVGNSLPSDVLPVLAIGARAVHIPHEVTWALERHDGEVDVPTLQSIRDLPDLLATW